MSAQREMSLDEWMVRLPEGHRANKELTALRAYVKELREALAGVVAVADRQTVEFDRAREVLGKEVP